MNFTIPYYNPQQFMLGNQIVNLGEGGPSSYMGLLAGAPKTYPTTYAIGTPGIGPMPRQLIGVTAPTTANQYSNPLTSNNLEIDGLFKNPTGG